MQIECGKGESGAAYRHTGVARVTICTSRNGTHVSSPAKVERYDYCASESWGIIAITGDNENMTVV